MLGTICMIGIGALMIAFVILLIAYTFDMNQVDEVIEDVSQEYWDEYWDEEGEEDETL